MSLTGYTLCTIYARQSTILPTSEPIDVTEVGYKQKYASGIGTQQADLIFARMGTIGGSRTVTFNLLNGTLRDGLGFDLEFYKWKSIYFYNLSTVHSRACCLGSSSANVLKTIKLDKVYCYGESQLFLSAPVNGIACSGTQNILTIKNTSATMLTYNVVVIGTSYEFTDSGWLDGGWFEIGWLA